MDTYTPEFTIFHLGFLATSLTECMQICKVALKPRAGCTCMISLGKLHLKEENQEVADCYQS